MSTFVHSCRFLVITVDCGVLFKCFTSARHGAICTASLRRVSMKRDHQHCLDKLAAAAPETKSALIRSLLPGIETALSSGHRLKGIWEALRKKGLQISYHSFHKTVSRSRKTGKQTSGWGKRDKPSEPQGLAVARLEAVEERDPLAT